LSKGSEMIQFRCGSCGTTLEVDNSQAGKQVQCSECKEFTLVPAAATCTNHPSLPATDQCSACGKSFCKECLAIIQGCKYCDSCKVLPFRTQQAPELAMVPCEQASLAMTYGIVSMVCFGFFPVPVAEFFKPAYVITQICVSVIPIPLAVWHALKAQRLMWFDPRLTGTGKAFAGLILGSIALTLWVIRAHLCFYVFPRLLLHR
jgi:hypothetical protein